MTFLWILIFQLFYSHLWTIVCATSTNNNNSTSMKYGLPQLTVGYMQTDEYYINITLGTPPQKQQLLIDISSPYTWFLSGASDAQCNKLNSGCLNNGLYYPAESTSSIKIYDFTSVDSDDGQDTGQSLNGTVFKDNWNFTNMEIVYTENVNKSKNMTTSINSNVVLTNNFIELKNSSFTCIESVGGGFGFLGLGVNMQSEDIGSVNPLFNKSLMFLEKFKYDGIIPTHSYSLWLGNRTYNDSSGYLVPVSNEYEGVLLLGGVDASLYEGSFYQFKMIPYISSYTNTSTIGLPILPMGPIYMSDHNGRKVNMTSEEYLSPVLLDSTTSRLHLPPSAIIQIAVQLGATYVKSLDRWLVPCDIAKTGAHLDFTFDGLVVEVPLIDLLSTTIDSATSTEMHFSDGSTACSLKLSSNVDIGFNVLGRAFIRNTYIAVDMEGYSVAIAKAKTLMHIIPDTAVLTSQEVLSFSASASASDSVSNSRSGKSVSIRAITSDSIPYATCRSAVTGAHLSIYVTATATDVPAQFTGIVNSNGLILGPGRSFYDTSRTSTTKKSTSPYSFFSLNGSGLESLINATGTTFSNHGQKRTVPILIDSQDNMSVWSKMDFSTWFSIIATSAILILTLWL